MKERRIKKGSILDRKDYSYTSPNTQRVKTRATAAFESPRRKWPFREMNIGAFYDISDHDEFRLAQRQAHSYGAKKKPIYRFMCRWNEDEGFGRIRRVE